MECWSLNPTQVLSRKSIAREGVFPEDVAVAAVAAVIQHCRQTLTSSRFRNKVYYFYFQCISASADGVKMISLTDSQSKSRVFHASTSGVAIWLPVNRLYLPQRAIDLFSSQIK